MSTQHTPGPWQYKRTSGFDYGSTAYWVPGICTNIDTEANARLIAAAPELLEALKAVLDNPYREGTASHERVKDIARAAIAKATGGAV